MTADDGFMCGPAIVSRWEKRIAELEAENERLRKATVSLSKESSGWEDAYYKASFANDELQSLLASGILLKQHSTDERPEKSSHILTIEIDTNVVEVAFWHELTPEYVYMGPYRASFENIRCWYGPIELPEEK